jgi:hypothetical protein
MVVPAVSDLTLQYKLPIFKRMLKRKGNDTIGQRNSYLTVIFILAL